jgi:hypothetical protein
MKGFNSELKEFIKYVFDKYGATDKRVLDFEWKYCERQRQEEEKKALKKALGNTPKKYVRVGVETADICKKLVITEISKGNMLGCYSRDFMGKLINAYGELDGEPMVEV